MTLDQLLFAITIGVASNVDNLGVGLSYGLRAARIPIAFLFVIPALSGIACFTGALVGNRITNVVSPHVCSIIGSTIMCCVGLWMVVQPLFQKDPQSPAQSRPQIGLNEMMFVAVAQAVTDLSIGFGVGFTRLSALYTALSVTVFSFFMLLVPIWIGRLVLKPGYQTGSSVLSGILLVLVGMSVLS